MHWIDTRVDIRHASAGSGTDLPYLVCADHRHRTLFCVSLEHGCAIEARHRLAVEERHHVLDQLRTDVRKSCRGQFDGAIDFRILDDRILLDPMQHCLCVSAVIDVNQPYPSVREVPGLPGAIVLTQFANAVAVPQLDDDVHPAIPAAQQHHDQRD